MLQSFCLENNIEYKAYSPAEIKRHATGKGNANKNMMIEAARERLGYQDSNDNEADAYTTISYLKLYRMDSAWLIYRNPNKIIRFAIYDHFKTVFPKEPREMKIIGGGRYCRGYFDGND